MENELRDMFRKAMRGFPSGIVVVTAADTGERYAVTLTSMMSLSLNPASLVISVNRNASIYAPLERGAGFCVNILTEDHRGVAQACADSDRRKSRFLSGRFKDEGGIPYLADAQANLFCAQNGRYLYATHALIIGRLEAAMVRDSVDPLVYLDGSYRSIGPLCDAGAREVTSPATSHLAV